MSLIVEDDQPFKDILASMGTANFDPMVAVALNEFARRIAAEVLCDAKDYSIHAGKEIIDADDVRTAIQLSDYQNVACIEPLDGMETLKKEINCQPLLSFEDPNSVLIRYPATSFPNTSVTYCSSELLDIPSATSDK